MENHNKSRKHLDNVYQLQCELADDDKLIEEINDDSENENENTGSVNPELSAESRSK